MVRAWLSVDEILCETLIGIKPDELSLPQKVKFGFSLEYNWEQAIATDSIENAVDYAALTEELKTFVSNSRFSLLETLSAGIAKKILAFSPKIITAKAHCKKIEAMPGTSGPKAEIELRIENGELRMENGELKCAEISSFFERLSEANREKKEANGG
jgi:FolB domain-containing protein